MSTESASQPGQSGTQESQSPSNSSSKSLILKFGKEDLEETQTSLRRVESLKSPDAVVSQLEISLHWARQEHIQALGDMLAVNESIESLKIVDTLVPKVGPRPFTFNMVPVAHGLVQNKSVNKLYVEGPCFDQDFWTILEQREASLRELSLVRAIWSRPESFLTNTVETNPSLEKLEYVDTPLHRKGAKAVGNVLRTNKTIKSLNLTRTELSHVRLLHITRGLKKNDTLLELNVSHNTISYTNELGDALTVNHTLQKLILDGNQFVDNYDSVNIANVLWDNRGLKVLSCNGCQLWKNQWGWLFGQALLHNDTLEELLLDGNPAMNEMDGLHLLDALRRNYSLLKLAFFCERRHDRFDRVALKKRIDFWNSLTPRGRAVVAGDGEPISLALLPKVLHKILRDGGAAGLYDILKQNPNFIVWR